MTYFTDPARAADALTHALTLGSDPALCASLAESLASDLREPAPAHRVELDPYPALARWRRLATTYTKRRAPLEVAAAWELTALITTDDNTVSVGDLPKKNKPQPDDDGDGVCRCCGYPAEYCLRSG